MRVDGLVEDTMTDLAARIFASHGGMIPSSYMSLPVDEQRSSYTAFPMDGDHAYGVSNDRRRAFRMAARIYPRPTSATIIVAGSATVQRISTIRGSPPSARMTTFESARRSVTADSHFRGNDDSFPRWPASLAEQPSRILRSQSPQRRRIRSSRLCHARNCQRGPG